MRILIVDDNQSLADAIAIGLRHKGHTVSTALNGEDGLLIFRIGDFDAVISDRDMPVMNGFQMVTEILRLKSNTKIVMMSGDPTNKPPAGIQLLEKPFGRDELLKALEIA